MPVEPILFWAWIQAPSTAMGLRLAACLGVFPVLYRALGDPGDGWFGGNLARRLFWALLGAAVFFTLTARWVPEDRDPTAGKGFDAFVRGVMGFRLGHAHVSGMEAAGSDRLSPKQSVGELKKAADLLPQSAYIQRYAGIALADRGDYEGGLQLLLRASALVEQRSPERGREERRLWTEMFGTPSPPPAQLQEAAAHLERWGLGWIGDVALLAAHSRLGSAAAPEGLRARVEATAAWWFVGVIGGATVVITTCLLGMISLVVGIILIVTRVLRPVPQDLHPVGSLLWEGFILMLALSALPSFITFGGRRLSPEAQPGLVALLLIASDILQILAVAYLACRLRGRGLNLGEIGFSKRHLGANVFLGVMAATVITPLAYLVGIITEQLSQRFFPNIAPPFHPLGLYTATSGSVEIRTALFLAAVVGAPLFEEIFFRGALFGALRRRFGFWPGVLLSAGFFAILHPQLPLGFLPIALIGAGFAVLAEWRQSLVPGIVAHAVNNGIAFMGLSLLFPRGG